MGLWKRLKTKVSGVLEEPPSFEDKLMLAQPETVWCLDHLEVGADRVHVNGWALTKEGTIPTFAVNGFVGQNEFGIPRPDLQKVMHFDKRAPNAGFTSNIFVEAVSLNKSDSLEIQLCDKETARPYNNLHAFYWPKKAEKFCFPEPERRKKVHGDTNLTAFIINGFSTYRKLSLALEDISSSWKNFNRILDWGCGCGRVLRYLPEEVMPRVTGVDIDADNIGWCKRTFLDSEFAAVPLLPGTSLKSEMFDLVFGISVFTHLKEQAQKAWLCELARVTARGGLLLLTIHGPAAVARSNLSENQFKGWIQYGFVDTGLNLDLKGAIPDDSYYVNTLHTHSYVRKEWGKYFEVIRIYPAFIANHQDLVVLRKR